MKAINKTFKVMPLYTFYLNIYIHPNDDVAVIPCKECAGSTWMDEAIEMRKKAIEEMQKHNESWTDKRIKTVRVETVIVVDENEHC